MIKRVLDFDITMSGYFKEYNYEIDVISDKYELQYIASGGVLLEYEDKTFELEGDCCWINLPGIRYHYSPMVKYGHWEHRYLVFKGDICTLWDELGLFPLEPCSVSSSLNFAGRIDAILKLTDFDLALNRLESMNMIEKLLIDLKRNGAAMDNSPRWITEIMSEINARNTLNPDYSAISSTFGMTRRTLFRQFLKATGMTPHAYHLKTKIHYITELLETGTKPLKEIADITGYSDIFYFSRQFKQLTQLTPSQCRARNRKIIRKNNILNTSIPLDEVICK